MIELIQNYIFWKNKKYYQKSTVTVVINQYEHKKKRTRNVKVKSIKKKIIKMKLLKCNFVKWPSKNINSKIKPTEIQAHKDNNNQNETLKIQFYEIIL